MSEQNNVVDAEIAPSQEPKKPTPKEALNILRQASRQYRGVAEEHETINLSVEVLEQVVGQ